MSFHHGESGQNAQCDDSASCARVPACAALGLTGKCCPTGPRPYLDPYRGYVQNGPSAYLDCCFVPIQTTNADGSVTQTLPFGTAVSLGAIAAAATTPPSSPTNPAA